MEGERGRWGGKGTEEVGEGKGKVGETVGRKMAWWWRMWEGKRKVEEKGNMIGKGSEEVTEEIRCGEKIQGLREGRVVYENIIIPPVWGTVISNTLLCYAVLAIINVNGELGKPRHSAASYHHM